MRKFIGWTLVAFLGVLVSMAFIPSREFIDPTAPDAAARCREVGGVILTGPTLKVPPGCYRWGRHQQKWYRV